MFFHCYLIVVSVLFVISSSSILHTAEHINAVDYHYDISKQGDQATFRFTLKNISYAADKLEIKSYFFSITFIDEHPKEVRLPENESISLENGDGQLKMENLEEDGSYFVCVIFLAGDPEHLITSSRFCHLVSMDENCQLEKSEKAFNNQHILIVCGFSVFIFIAVVIITIIRDRIYRRKKIADILKSLPAHVVHDLETLAETADLRRIRKPPRALSNRLREDSQVTIDYDPNDNHDFYNYHNYDDASLEILPEEDLPAYN